MGSDHCLSFYFGDLDPPNLSQKVFVCMLSHGPLDGMFSNFASVYKSDRIIIY